MGKRKKDKKNKKDKRKPNRSTSESDSSTEEEWVEADKLHDNSSNVGQPTENLDQASRDDWMSMAFSLSGPSQLEKRKQKELDKKKERDAAIEKPGQSTRELNPYWKDGGSGLPSTENNQRHVGSVGDHGYEWLKKSYVRAQEQAKEEGRSLESVAAERWGSLEKLQSLLEEAESKMRRPDDRRRRRDDIKHHQSRNDNRDGRRDPSTAYRDRYHRREDDHNSRERHFSDRRSERSSSFRKPMDENDEDDPKRKPDREDSRSASGQNRSYSGKGWKKNKEEPRSKMSSVRGPDVKRPQKEDAVIDVDALGDTFPLLSHDEMNKLSAKIIKAEIMGNEELVKSLKLKLQKAKEAAQTQAEQDKVIILTQTDSKGFTRPVKGVTSNPSGSRNKRKVETHENNKRVRYFADDDDKSLKEMFESEKYDSAYDQNATFIKLMGKEMSRRDNDLALDDPFEETASVDNRRKQDEKAMNRAVREQQKREKAYDDCHWCLNGRNIHDSIIVQTKSKVYLCVPPFQSLTTGHCLIVPNFHVSCSTQMDEDMWEEVKEMRKELVKVFMEKEEEDIIFFESASFLHKHPHMVLHCVPVPKESGDVAPIYFKKALLECEHEWATNKKVIELAGRDVRKAVPKGLPYFAVDFGLQSGYAHVIEDLKVFPNNFAQEIIGGMLDLDHTVWRKNKRETDENVKKKKEYLKNLLQDNT